MNVFGLLRKTDVTGVSGTGFVATGIEFEDGRCALRWRVGEHRSTTTWDSLEAVRAIHGHDGATEIVPLATVDLPDALEDLAAGELPPPEG